MWIFRDVMGGRSWWWNMSFICLLLGCFQKCKAEDKKHELKPQPKKHGHDSSSEELGPHNEREGLRCYKCDPTEYNNYCRDFKPSMSTPYDCTQPNHHGHDGKHSKSPSPIEVTLDLNKPFSCFKIQADVAYGHGKVYGAKRYGCGHLTQVRSTPVKLLDHECSNVLGGKDPKGKEFFEGIICNCDNADGCNTASSKLYYSITNLILAMIWSIFA